MKYSLLFVLICFGLNAYYIFIDTRNAISIKVDEKMERRSEFLRIGISNNALFPISLVYNHLYFPGEIVLRDTDGSIMRLIGKDYHDIRTTSLVDPVLFVLDGHSFRLLEFKIDDMVVIHKDEFFDLSKLKTIQVDIPNCLLKVHSFPPYRFSKTVKSGETTVSEMMRLYWEDLNSLKGT